MAEPDTTVHDYSTGVPRHHHRIYMEDGNLVLQVENAIFKVHRSFLAKKSSVIQDMLGVPQSDTTTNGDGTDERLLVLSGDSATGWELLLESLYERFAPRHDLFTPSSPERALSNPFDTAKPFDGEQSISVLKIAHKYRMGKFEAFILRELQKASTAAGYVELMVAAQITGSEPLYKQALEALISFDETPDLAQAQRIGVEATYAILSAKISEKDAALEVAKEDLKNVTHKRCQYCNYVATQGGAWRCNSCSKSQHS